LILVGVLSGLPTLYTNVVNHAEYGGPYVVRSIIHVDVDATIVATVTGGGARPIVVDGG
jgi:hypothetical protein